MNTTTLSQSKKLKEWGAPQEDASAYWLEAGHQYGYGYGRAAEGLTEETLIVMGEGRLGTGQIGYGEGTRFPCIKYPEYSSDNYYEYPMSACLATYSLEELISWLIGDRRNSFYLEYDDEWSLYENEPEPGYKWRARYYDRTPVGFYEAVGVNPIEAVYNLAEAIHNQQKEVND